MRLSCLILGTVLAAASLHADPLPPLPLWPNGAPGALGTKDSDIPTVTAFLPPAGTGTGAAFVICPGGGYGGLAGHEGAGYAQWLAERGIAGIVLKYRLSSGGYHHPAMLQDMARAMRLVRAKAAEWKIDPHRVGVMGSSAGGHLAATILTHFDSGKPDDPDPVERESSRPDLGVLCYAVITMGPDTQSGTHDNLLGPDPDPALVDDLSNERQVKKDTPPCFIWHTFEDNTVKVKNALLFASALEEKHIPFELHIYEKGGHGMGLGKPGTPFEHHRWSSDLLAWLRERGWAAPADPAAAPAPVTSP